MSKIVKAIKRDEIGTGASRRLRKENKVPAIIYGKNIKPTNIYIEHNDIFYELQKENFHTSIITLELDSKKIDVILRDFQMHPFKPKVNHIDFQKVDNKNPIKIKVPLHLINAEISPAVKLSGGRISQLIRNIEILATANNIPTCLEVDLKNTTIGQIIHMSDIPVPKGVEIVSIKNGKNHTIATTTSK